MLLKIFFKNCRVKGKITYCLNQPDIFYKVCPPPKKKVNGCSLTKSNGAIFLQKLFGRFFCDICGIDIFSSTIVHLQRLID